MTFKDLNTFQQWIAETEAETGERVDGWVEYRNDGTVEFLIADTSEPYGC